MPTLTTANDIVRLGEKQFLVKFADGTELGPYPSYLTAEINRNAEVQRREISNMTYPTKTR